MSRIIFFSAPWCVACRGVKPLFERECRERDFTEYEYVDVDEDEDNMADKYRIKNLPCLVRLDDSGRGVKRAVGNFAYREIWDD